VLLPLHDPVRIAEQLVVLDLIAPGRITFVAGLGYRDAEYEMAGVDKKQRGRLLEEYVEVLRKAWTGEPFEWRGREVLVTPTPATPGGPMIMIGGGSEPAARRAARLRCGFFPSLGDQALADAYDDEARKVGFEGGFCSLPKGPSGMVLVSDDPDALWEQVGPHALYDAQIYSSWQRNEQASAIDVHDAQSWEDVRASGVYQILTPDECVALAEEQGDFGTVMLHPLVGGLSPDIAWSSLELFDQKVLPRLRPGV
jgi:alkanesulfonate monooxygenase SsuD/methylene tetrahydromethanopterin reductase-like flavin-dependent oxidoreductase (luciferase family)